MAVTVNAARTLLASAVMSANAATKSTNNANTTITAPSRTGVRYQTLREALISSIFQNGEVGVDLDFSDMATMFQDTAGATPVTALGQAIVLMLDKSKGLALGAEQKSGFFATAVGTATVATYNTSTGAGTVYRTNVSNQSFLRLTGLTANRLYKVSVTNTSSAANTISVRQNGSASTVDTVGVGTTKILYVSTVTYTDISIVGNVDGQTFTFTINSVQEIAGNHVRFTNATLQARVNLFTNTEDFTTALWGKAGSGTGSTATLTANYAAAPDGATTATRVQLALNGGSTTSDISELRGASTNLVAIDNVTRTMSLWVKSNTGSTYSVQIRINGAVVLASIGPTWQRITVTGASSSDNSTSLVRLRGASSCSDSADILVWHPQLEVGYQATTYQRVNTATDYADVGAPRSVNFNGTSTSGVTLATVDPGVDKVDVFAVVRKASDAATGIVCELSTNTGALAGTFFITAPQSAGVGNYGARASGSLFPAAINSSGAFPAPITNVQTGIVDISGDSVILRVNGTQVSSGSADLGTGNFGNYQFYIGARAGSSLWFNGDLYRLVVRFGSSNLDANKRTAIERSLGNAALLAW